MKIMINKLIEHNGAIIEKTIEVEYSEPCGDQIHALSEVIFAAWKSMEKPE